MAYLAHDLFLLMLNLAQVKNAQRVLDLFIEALNAAQDQVMLRLVLDGDSAESETVPVATTRSYFGEMALIPRQHTLSPEVLTLVRNAIGMLALVLENEKQARLLAGENVRLETLNQELIALTRVKDEFVSNVSHELSTPITSLKLRQHLLNERPDQLSLHLPVIKRETDRLARIINDLLQLSRLDQQRVVFDPIFLRLDRLAEQYVMDREPLAASRGLALRFEADPDLPPVEADEGLIGQAVGVLMTNALNYTPPGGRVVVRVMAQVQNDRPGVALVVADTGPGIPADELPRLFERFFRGQTAIESGAPGTGLGLAILDSIVRQHGGTVAVASDGIPGQGSTFTVWLPVY